VVTGAGVVSALGSDLDAFWSACQEGRGAVAPVPAVWHRLADLRSRYWAPLGDAARPTSQLLARGETRRLDPTALMALAAAEEALRRAGLSLGEGDRRHRTFRVAGWVPERTGIFFGTGIGGFHSLVTNAAQVGVSRSRARLRSLADTLRADGQAAAADEVASVAGELLAPEVFNPFTVAMTMPNAPAGQLAIKLGVHGPTRTFAGACASSTVALGQAFRAVRDGEVDVAVSGGSEYLAEPTGCCFRAFDALGALAHGELPPERLNRPFDARRSGFLFGEGGCAVLLLEELAAARARGAPLLAEVIGYGESCDAHDIVALHPSGAQIRRAIEQCLADARLEPADVGYVNAHGTGTPGNDAVEASVLAALFGNRTTVSSTKSLLGHTLGASGALEAAATVLSLRDGVVHPSRNVEEPVADLDFPAAARRLPGLRHALSESFAFGGQNAVLAFRRVG
jgi:3-oxoacyl-[acyl-carrier-protein] synthase II